jgi:hypothetical protein
MARRVIRCWFCGDAATRATFRLECSGLTPEQTVPEGTVRYVRFFQLCRRHYEVLREAGARGRVDAKTGIRWWLVDPPELTSGGD